MAELALAAGDVRSALLKETFAERRSWIVSGVPGMTDILRKFNVFVNDPDQVRSFVIDIFAYPNIESSPE